MNFFQRQAAAFNNDMARSCGALLGIAQGVLADGELRDSEVMFLRDWLSNNENLAAGWPGNVLLAKVNAALLDGVISPAEREHLIEVLQQLVGGTLAELAAAAHVSNLALEVDVPVRIAGSVFCLTGDFVYGPRNVCERLLNDKGAMVSRSVSKRVAYVVMGGLGSAEWKHGSFGTKVEHAMRLKASGCGLHIIHEDALMTAAFEKAGS